MKVYAVTECWCERDVEGTCIVKIFKNEKDANNFHEELISLPENKYKRNMFYVEEYEVSE